MLLKSTDIPKLEHELKEFINSGRLGLYQIKSIKWPQAAYLLHVPPREYHLLDREGEITASDVPLSDVESIAVIRFNDIDVSRHIKPNYGR